MIPICSHQLFQISHPKKPATFPKHNIVLKYPKVYKASSSRIGPVVVTEA